MHSCIIHTLKFRLRNYEKHLRYNTPLILEFVAAKFILNLTCFRSASTENKNKVEPVVLWLSSLTINTVTRVQNLE